MSDVTVLGTGLMGTGVAGALIEAGHDVTVWNRTAEKAAPLVSRGATLAASAHEAIAASPLTISVLIGYDTVKSVVGSAGATVAGKDFVNFTSGGPSDAIAMAEWCDAQGLHYLDGSLLCFPSDIGNEGRIKYSGDASAWSRHEGLLAGLGDTEYLGGDVSLANVMDGVILAYYIPLLGAAMEAAAFGAAHGIPVPTVMNELRSLDKITRKFLIDSEPLMVAGDHTTNEATVEIYRAGVQDVIKAMADTGLRSYMMQAVVDYLALSENAGHKDYAFSAVFADHLATRL